MKTKILLIVVLLAFGVNAIPSYSLYKVYQQIDTLTHTNLDSNLLRGSDWSVKLVDTLEKKFIRFEDVKDSSFQKIDVDTITSDTIHITGNAKIDGALNATADSASGALRLGGQTKDYYEPAFSKNAGFNPTQNVNSTASPTFAGLAVGPTTGDYIIGSNVKTVNIRGVGHTSDHGAGISFGDDLYSRIGLHSYGKDAYLYVDSGDFHINLIDPSKKFFVNGNMSYHAGNLTPAAIGAAPYLDTTFYDSLFDGATYKARALCRLVKIGDVVTFTQNALFATLAGGNVIYLKGIPSSYLPVTGWTSLAFARQNSADIIGLLYMDVSNLTISQMDNVFSAGTGGINHTTFTWTID